MIDRLLRALLWDKKLTPRWRALCALLIVLSPLAWAGAVFLQFRIVQSVPVRILADRERAVEAAHRLAERYGFNTQGWQERVRTEAEMDIYRYLYLQGEAGWELLRSTGAWSSVAAKLFDADDDYGVEVELAPSGAVTGYHVRPREGAPEAVSDGEATAIAEARKNERLASRPGWRATDLSVATGPNNTRVYQWTIRVPAVRGLDAKLTLRLRGRRIVEDRISFELNRAGRESLPGRGGRQALKAVYIAGMVLAFFYLLVRYVRRRLQKEASRERMHLVALITGSAVLAILLLTDVITFNTNEAALPYWAVLIFASLASYGTGLVAGLAYSAAESDLREPFGGQFVSLDAWLAGRFFSRNVGRSVLLGVVVLGWMLLVRDGVYLAGKPHYPGLDVLDGAYDYITSSIIWLSVLLVSASAGIYLVLSATMAPLAFVTRRFAPRWRTAFFLGFSAMATGFLTAEPLPWYSAIPLAVWQAATIAAAFLVVDLLAALVVATGYFLLVYFVSLAQIAPGWAERIEPALAVVVVSLLAAVYSAIRGRFVRADEVRPAYARDIVERLQLQSEVAAAREAQQRLLPAAAPRMPGLAIVATCRSAEEVSGDFYDFFPISRERLGILMTDGGGNGLATALSIAMTKGYLMHKAQSGESPVRTLAGLLATLGEELHTVNSEGLCYAVADIHEGWLHFARLGDTPGLLVAGTDERVEETRFGDEGGSLWEGRVRLRPNMRLVLYTNGVSRLIGEPDRQATNRWLLRKAASVFSQPPEELLEWLLNLVLGRRGALAGRRITDDVTLMVIAIDRDAVLGVEERVA